MNTNLKIEIDAINQPNFNSLVEAKTFIDFPDKCPLDGADPCNGDVYLICTDLSANDPGFKTAKENKKYKNVTDPMQICTKHGISVFSDLESCKHQLEAFPGLGTKIATAKLTKDDGFIKRTFKTPLHHTWWPYKNENRHLSFTVVKEV
ncbi:hypothetical protein [Comamonas jiangduensis]|uniref:Uncharacterized protein n=1 Tax=Comamonas jiangduensis TaxID=1194168 RepID=A0ABV4IGD5_9BURK